MDRVNQVRSAHGLNALQASGRLSAAADRQCREVLRRGHLTHDSSAGSPMKRLKGGRKRPVGENIAFVSRRSPSRVVQMWLSSPAHRTVMLSGAFRKIGLAAKRGRLAGSRGLVVTADFSG